jgi:hypothetical protein
MRILPQLMHLVDGDPGQSIIFDLTTYVFCTKDSDQSILPLWLRSNLGLHPYYVSILGGCHIEVLGGVLHPTMVTTHVPHTSRIEVSHLVRYLYLDNKVQLVMLLPMLVNSPGKDVAQVHEELTRPPNKAG